MTVREETSRRLPDAALRKEIERREAQLSTPLEKLRFIRAAVDAYDQAPEVLRESKVRIASRIVVAEAGARVGNGGDRLLRAGYRGAALYERAKTTLTGRKLVFVLGLAAVMASVGAAPSMLREWRAEPEAEPLSPAALSGVPTREVWLVESDETSELYSNGLQVSNEFLTHNKPRRYPWLPPTMGPEASHALDAPDWRSLPAGIVFHTTVTETAPMLERSNNQLLRSHGELLMRYLAREKLYNFVIDRFGRVYRLVPEDEYAYHAGFSAWADGQASYVDLNESFLGVAFETRPEAVQPGVRPEAAVTEAQVDSARRLTRMLRERYGIPAENCVTHEMISLNPDKRLLGYHTDWSGRFPFASVGLADNYELEPPAVRYWGFRPDASFRSSMGETMKRGVEQAERSFAADARARGVPQQELRSIRLRDFHALRAKLKAVKAADPEASRSH